MQKFEGTVIQAEFHHPPSRYKRSHFSAMAEAENPVLWKAAKIVSAFGLGLGKECASSAAQTVESSAGRNRTSPRPISLSPGICRDAKTGHPDAWASSKVSGIPSPLREGARRQSKDL